MVCSRTSRGALNYVMCKSRDLKIIISRRCLYYPSRRSEYQNKIIETQKLFLKPVKYRRVRTNESLKVRVVAIV